MNPRLGLTVGAVVTAAVALILAVVPAAWLADMLGASGDDGASFLLRRYGASATAALWVATVAIVRSVAARRAVLLALAAWFGVQALVAVLGLSTGTVSGLAWLAVIADPVLAAWFYLLARRVGANPHRLAGTGQVLSDRPVSDASARP